MTCVPAACSAVVCLCLAVAPLQAAEPESGRAAVLAFLKAHVIGKTVRADESVERADNGKSETVVSDTCTYHHLEQTANGFRFDLTQVISRTTYALEGGKRSGAGRRTDVVNVFRYSLAERRSTGELVGADHVAASTESSLHTKDLLYAVRMRMENGALLITETTVDYEDIPVGGKLRPGGYEYRERLVLADGRLQKQEKLTTYLIDLKTGTKTASGPPAEVVWTETAP